jgi:hypothetical protein
VGEGLSAKDIVSILKACHENGVRVFEYGTLRFELGTPTTTETVSHETIPSVEPAVDEPDTPMDQDELKVQMLIDDPLALEEMIMRGDNQA